MLDIDQSRRAVGLSPRRLVHAAAAIAILGASACSSDNRPILEEVPATTEANGGSSSSQSTSVEEEITSTVKTDPQSTTTLDLDASSSSASESEPATTEAPQATTTIAPDPGGSVAD